MSILDCIRQIDWNDAGNKKIAQNLVSDAIEYAKRVEAHIYQGNEIRADSFMDVAERQDAIRQLDKKRTHAHNKMLDSMEPFLDLLIKETDFDKNDYKLENRTQKADFVASMVFELINKKPTSYVEGNVRDELVEMIHNGEISYEELENEAHHIIGY